MCTPKSRLHVHLRAEEVRADASDGAARDQASHRASDERPDGLYDGLGELRPVDVEFHFRFPFVIFVFTTEHTEAPAAARKRLSCPEWDSFANPFPCPQGGFGDFAAAGAPLRGFGLCPQLPWLRLA